MSCAMRSLVSAQSGFDRPWCSVDDLFGDGGGELGGQRIPHHRPRGPNQQGIQAILDEPRCMRPVGLGTV